LYSALYNEWTEVNYNKNYVNKSNVVNKKLKQKIVKIYTKCIRQEEFTTVTLLLLLLGYYANCDKNAFITRVLIVQLYLTDKRTCPIRWGKESDIS